MLDYDYEAVQELRPKTHRRKPNYQELDEGMEKENDIIRN